MSFLLFGPRALSYDVIVVHIVACVKLQTEMLMGCDPSSWKKRKGKELKYQVKVEK